jgi:hypothetical protein
MQHDCAVNGMVAAFPMLSQAQIWAIATATVVQNSPADSNLQPEYSTGFCSKAENDMRAHVRVVQYVDKVLWSGREQVQSSRRLSLLWHSHRHKAIPAMSAMPMAAVM